MDKSKVIENIHTTGFVLEYKVSQLLEKNGWNVINNRYYLDDIQLKNREIDIVAYKTNKVEGITYYTSLIISCKKSAEDMWSFLTKGVNQRDPNINICPIWNWTNDSILQFMLDEGIEDRVWELTSDNDDLDFVYGINDQVFAYQQLNKNKNYSTNNDKQIYGSIESTIKALEYEKGTLDKRRDNKALYNFNLLSIFDGDMVKIHFDDGEETVEEIDEIKYLNRLIFNGNEGFYRVHFLKFDKMEEYIKHFNKLTDWNVKFYADLIEKYYETFTEYEDNKGVELLLNQFERNVRWCLSSSSDYHIDKITLKYDSKEQVMEVGVNCSEGSRAVNREIVEEFNGNGDVIEQVKAELKELYRYEGEVRFEDYDFLKLPF
ncbi:hypothetical protein HXA34_20550 [Salipaludibacillus agaradhaerens]|jgi:hypothetical protein|uniref:hypothetical protein n=1 Tax=Salipaludibacillus agaradhaerens TaxID=76935 RepID=UPI0021515718|nr:hypothetical protein [Salipaludibacillus agaradhaerens]MCR6108690.1 hypothetical protein [Salipaludibacillus agaradhaerens]MCR6120713.1 hypothetical protein [Salipaludibacillus agaradhaerens]